MAASPSASVSAPSDDAALGAEAVPREAGGSRTGRRLRALSLRAARAVLGCLPWLAAGLGAAIPVINSTVKAVQSGWTPAGDDGIIAIRGWDVLTSHTPLVGQYSEAGLVVHGQVMHSPGPMLYWLLALPARFGSASSITIAMGALNVLSIIGCVALARRRGGLVLMFATAIGIALMCQSLPTLAMHDIWNPAAGLFPMLLLIFLGWSLACGEYRLLPITVLVASYVTQTHLMFLAPTLVVLAVGFGGLALGALRRRRARVQGAPAVTRGRMWPWALAAVVVALACWAEPAIQQVENNPGNLTMIARTAEHRGPQLGRTAGWNAVVRAVGVTPWWLYVPASEWQRKLDVRVTPSRGRRDSAIALLALLALAGLVGAVGRRRDLTAASLIGLGLCLAIGAEAASNPSAKLLEETLGYTMWWGSEVGLWVWLILAWAAWLALVWAARPAVRALSARASAHPGARRVRFAGVLLASLAALAAVVWAGRDVAQLATPDPHLYEYRPITQAAADVERLIPPGRTVAYRFGVLDPATQPMEPGLRFLLIRHGDLVLADGSLPRLGSYYVLGGRPVQATLFITNGRRPQRGMTLAARVHFTGPWGPDVLSAWVSRTTAQRHRAPRAHGRLG